MQHPKESLLIAGIIFWLIDKKFIASGKDIKDLKEKIIHKLKNDKVFITNEDLTLFDRNMKTYVDNKFVSLAVFNEFKTGIDKQFNNLNKRLDEGTGCFKTVFERLDSIKDILIEREK